MAAKDVFVVNGNLPLVIIKISPTSWVTLQHIAGFDFSGTHPLLLMQDGRRVVVQNMAFDETEPAESKSAQFWQWISESVEEALHALMD